MNADQSITSRELGDRLFGMAVGNYVKMIDGLEADLWGCRFWGEAALNEEFGAKDMIRRACNPCLPDTWCHLFMGLGQVDYHIL